MSLFKSGIDSTGVRLPSDSCRHQKLIKKTKNLFVFGATAPSWPGPPHSRGFYITHDNRPQSVGL